MSRRRIRFDGPGRVSVESRPRPDPGPDEVLIETACSAVSPGTEGLLFAGAAPASLPTDGPPDAIGQDLSYPLAPGYAAVGRVRAVGAAVDESWLDKRVFAYHSHESHFCVSPAELVSVPDTVETREAAFLATMETAVTLVLDGAPLLGERVAVFGQGVVGLLTTALVAASSVESVLAVERVERRRERARALGATEAISPDRLDHDDGDGVVGLPTDLTFELTGNPDTLDGAIEVTGFDGRVVVGSWYGTNPVSVDLGGRFHRDRIDLRSSQVSTIPPALSGRWSRERRHRVAWEWIERLDVASLCTHELSIEQAESAYRLLDDPRAAIQVLFTYD